MSGAQFINAPMGGYAPTAPVPGGYGGFGRPPGPGGQGGIVQQPPVRPGLMSGGADQSKPVDPFGQVPGLPGNGSNSIYLTVIQSLRL